MGSGWFADELKVSTPRSWNQFTFDASEQAISLNFGDWEESLWFERGFLELSTGLSLGFTEEPREGTLRWTGEDFQGFDGLEWISLSTDSAFLNSPASAITDQQLDRWQQAYQWGNHESQNYLQTESDPFFAQSPAALLTSVELDQIRAAYGWGNHRLVGYLTGEADPVFQNAPAAAINSGQMSAWDQAYAWGNHATQGYLTTESDPTVSLSEPGFLSYWTGTALEAAPLRIEDNTLQLQSDTHVEGTMEVTGEVTLYRLKRQGDIFMGPFGEGSDVGPGGGSVGNE